MAELVVIYDTATGKRIVKLIGSAHIADLAVVSGKIGNAAVISGSIASGQVGTPHIAAGAIVSALVGANVLATPHFANQGILSASFGANVLATPHMLAGGILSSAIGLEAVGLPHIVRGATSGQVLAAQGAGANPAYAALVASDVGLGNVDNTSDATKNAATATLTNKRVTPRVGTVASHATPTINTDDVDVFLITAQAEAITSMTTNLSGTPTNGQLLLISIVGTAARAITWGASFEDGLFALPSTTVTTQRLDTLLVWNAATSKWRCVVTQGDLDLAAKSLIAGKVKFTDILIKESGYDMLHVRNAADSAYRGLAIGDTGLWLYSGRLEFIIDAQYIGAPGTDDFYTAFKAQDNGVGPVEVARLQGAAEPYFGIGLNGQGIAIRTVKVTKAYNSTLFDAVALTDSDDVWAQPAGSVLLAVKIKMTAQFVAAGLTDLDITMGLAGDVDGLLVQAMNLTSDVVSSQYTTRGAYWNEAAAMGFLTKDAATTWRAYATAVGANLSTLSAGSVDFYFTYLDIP